MMTPFFPAIAGMLALLACPPDAPRESRSGVSEPVKALLPVVLHQAPPRNSSNSQDDADDDEPADHSADVRAWLGIQFGPVPEVLASHLQNDGGAIVVNIARNSPADKAGLKRYDVILRIN